MSAKRTAFFLFGGILLASCKAKLTAPEFRVRSMQDLEILLVTDKYYNAQFSSGKDGNIFLHEETRKDPSGPVFTVSINVKTPAKTKARIEEKTYDLIGKHPGYQSFMSNDDEKGNPSYLSSAFGKDIHVALEIEGEAPLVETIYSPAPMNIIGPLIDPITRHVREVTAATEIKWTPDPRLQNRIFIDVFEHTMPNETTGEWPQGASYVLATPDDGSLSVSNLLPYIPKNGNAFSVTLTRYSYKAVKSGGKKYLVLSSTRETISYQFIP